MTDERMIEEAKKAIVDAWSWVEYLDVQDALAIDAARAALAVFEKAHTPTDDEREALAKEWADKEFPEMPLAPENEQLADAAYEAFCAGYDAGFRRSEVTEPHDREAKIHGELVTMRVDDWRRITDELAQLRTLEGSLEPQGEPSDDERETLERTVRNALDAYYAQSNVGPVASAEKLVADAILVSRQGEPSDVQVKAVARTLNLNGWTCGEGADEPGNYDQCEDCRRCCDGLARAALRAAWEVGR